jgi:hypothetical protein
MSPTSLAEASHGGLAAFAGPDLTSRGRNNSAATYLNAGSLEFQAMLRNSSIVPYGADQTVYLVVEGLGPEGLARETAVERTDLETIITEMLSGRYGSPTGVMAFNTLEHWSDDLSREVAQEIQCRCDIEGRDVPDYLQDFVDHNISRSRKPDTSQSWGRRR